MILIPDSRKRPDGPTSSCGTAWLFASLPLGAHWAAMAKSVLLTSGLSATVPAWCQAASCPIHCLIPCHLQDPGCAFADCAPCWLPT